jgi:hypothetical protein
MNPLQNPMHWTREHQFAWAIMSVIGAGAGLLLGFMHSPFFSMLQTGPLSQTGQAFIVWLSIPNSYWLWSLFGFLITGLAFYAVQLFRTSN